eukprot:321104_1
MGPWTCRAPKQRKQAIGAREWAASGPPPSSSPNSPAWGHFTKRPRQARLLFRMRLVSPQRHLLPPQTTDPFLPSLSLPPPVPSCRAPTPLPVRTANRSQESPTA